MRRASKNQSKRKIIRSTTTTLRFNSETLEETCRVTFSTCPNVPLEREAVKTASGATKEALPPSQSIDIVPARARRLGTTFSTSVALCGAFHNEVGIPELQ